MVHRGKQSTVAGQGLGGCDGFSCSTNWPRPRWFARDESPAPPNEVDGEPKQALSSAPPQNRNPTRERGDLEEIYSSLQSSLTRFGVARW